MDSDGDGLSDLAETSGWTTQAGAVFVTGPDDPDSDGDGLSDGEEAGALITHGRTSYVGHSSPRLPDTDSDGVGDAEEYFLDMDAQSRDTDADGLPDNVELEFDSDPTFDNPDGDGYSDKAEYDRGSNPMAYDLRPSEARKAFLVGAIAGDATTVARIAGMRDEQLQSVEYLAGQIASGLVGIGDIRDFVANVGNLDFIGAAVSVAGLVPVAGDALKSLSKMKKFAAQGSRAEVALQNYVEARNWPASTKKTVLTKVLGRSATTKLPKALKGGPKVYTNYVGRLPNDKIVYCGITRNLRLRTAQHNNRTFTISPIKGATRQSRGVARAVEEACILRVGLTANGGARENKIHSVNPKSDYYDQAVSYGENRLQKLDPTLMALGGASG